MIGNYQKRPFKTVGILTWLKKKIKYRREQEQEKGGRKNIQELKLE